jgi:hypothetical protein
MEMENLQNANKRPSLAVELSDVAIALLRQRKHELRSIGHKVSCSGLASDCIIAAYGQPAALRQGEV